MIEPAMKKEFGLLYRAAHLAFAHNLREETEKSLTKERFAEILTMALDVFKVAPNEMKDAFGVTPATVSRWKNAEAAPGVFVRMKVIEWVADIVQTMVPDAPRGMQDIRDKELKKLLDASIEATRRHPRLAD